MRNVLLVIADDMGQEQVSAYGINLNPDNYASTPNVNRLAQQGVRFNRYYTQPWCSPTRAAVLTGSWGFMTGIGSLSDRQNQPLLGGEVCLPAAIKAATNNAYTTALIGKHHLSTNLTYGGALKHPVNCGFDWWQGALLNFEGASNENYYNWNRVTSYRQGNDIKVDRRVCFEYAGLQQAYDAVDWISRQEKPWFCQVAMNLPHSPLARPPSYMFDTERWDCPSLYPPDTTYTYIRNYFKAMVEAMDWTLGYILDNIPQDVLANTTIIFTTDNGTGDPAADPEYQSIFGPVNHFKNSPYELGIRNPMIFAGSGVKGSGRSTDAICAAPDLFMTVIDAVGGDVGLIPANPAHGRPSTSMWPVVLGSATTLRTFAWTDNFSPNGPNLNCSTLGTRTMRYDRYKLIRQRTTGVTGFPASPVGVGNLTDELYDLVTDSLELTNLIAGAFDLTALEASHPGITAAYDAAVAQYGTFTSTYA